MSLHKRDIGVCPDGYRPLKSVDGTTVGYVCEECGRLSTASHRTQCAMQAKIEGPNNTLERELLLEAMRG